MKVNKIIIITLLLLFVITISNVSATNNTPDKISSNIIDKPISNIDTNHNDKSHITVPHTSNPVEEIKDKTVQHEVAKGQKPPIKIENNDVYVNKSSESSIEEGTKLNPYKTIDESIINELKSGTIVNIANGKYELNTINLNNNISIIGQNKDKTILYTNSKNGLFNINNNSNLRLVNLTIRDYESTVSPTINNNGILVIENLFFQNATRNITSANGGFIYNTNNLQVKNCEFDSAKASYGACIYTNSAQTLIINTTFTNSEILNVGGAIYSKNSKTEIYNSTFMYNKAVSGAAVYNAFGNLTVNNTYFFKNDAQTFYAGAIYNTGRAITTNSRFIENHATRDGGAITNTNYFYSKNCTYTLNCADNGGAIENVPCDENEIGTLKLINNTFSENNAVNHGGVIINYNIHNSTADIGAITIINSKFIENSATEGGVIYNECRLNITDSTFKENYADQGSSIYMSSGSANLQYNKFIDNDDNENSIYSPYETLDKTKNKFLSAVEFKIEDIPDFISETPIELIVTEINNDNTFNDNVDVVIGNETYIIPIINGKGRSGLITPQLTSGKYIATINFSETDKYAPTSALSNEFLIISETSFLVLNETISKAGNTITLDHDYTYDPVSDSGFKDGIIINKNLTVYGEDKTIDADGKSRIFYVADNGDLKLINIKLINGNASYGGAIANMGKLNIKNSILEDNTGINGSAIWTYNSEDVNINYIKFIDNYNNTDSVYAKKGTVNTSESKFLKKVVFEISIPEYVDTQIPISLTATTKDDDFNGVVMVNIGSEEHYITVTNGKSRTILKTNLQSGKYIATINFSETDKYASANAKSNNFTIISKNSTIASNSIVKPIKKTSYKVTIYLTLKKVKKVSKKVKKLYLKVIVKRNGKKLLSKNITLKVKSKKSEKSEKLGSLKNYKFTVKINGKIYTKKTNKKGKAIYTITNISKKGIYKAKISYKSKKYYKNGKNIKIRIKI